MNYETGLESILADLVKRTRLRPLLDGKVAKTLNQLAKDERRQPYRLLLDIEKDVSKKVKTQCGIEFTNWMKVRWEAFRQLVALDLTECNGSSSQPLTFASYGIRTLVEQAFRDLKCDGMAGPDYDAWLRLPFKAWVDYVALQLEISSTTIKKRLCEAFTDPATGSDFSRTYRRWYNDGDNVGNLPDGHRALVCIATAIPLDTVDGKNLAKLDHFTSWLLLSVGLQSIGEEERNRLIRPRASALSVLQRSPHVYKTVSIEERHQACRFVEDVTIPYQEGELDISQLESLLDDWQSRAAKNAMIRVQYGRLRARVARAQGDNASSLYESVVKLSARAGWTDREHHACLLEALGYSRQLKSRYAFAHFWDLARKSYVLTEMSEQPSLDQLAFIDHYGRVDPRRLPLAVIYQN